MRSLVVAISILVVLVGYSPCARAQDLAVAFGPGHYPNVPGPTLVHYLQGNAGARPKAKVNKKDGAEMVYVPGGEFMMGDKDIKENPPHRVTLSGYYIYKNLVTVA